MTRRNGNGDANSIIDKITASGLVKLTIGVVIITAGVWAWFGVPGTLADAAAVKDDISDLQTEQQSIREIATEDRSRLDEIEVTLDGVTAQLEVISVELHDLGRIRLELQRAITRAIRRASRAP